MIKILIILGAWILATALVLATIILRGGYLLLWKPWELKPFFSEMQSLPGEYWELAEEIWNWGRD